MDNITLAQHFYFESFFIKYRSGNTLSFIFYSYLVFL